MKTKEKYYHDTYPNHIAKSAIEYSECISAEF